MNVESTFRPILRLVSELQKWSVSLKLSRLEVGAKGMQVVYLGRPSRRTNPAPQVEGDVIELLTNNWDDYGFETSFPVTCRMNGEVVDMPGLRLLIAEARTSRTVLDKIRGEGWDGVFPIPNTDYVSVPGEITFYQQIEGALGIEAAVEVAKVLRDASYLVHLADDADAKVLVESEGFRKSLQRERASTQAYLDGWRVFERQAIAVLDLGFRFENIFGNITTLDLKFQPRTRLPHDVNVLIGPNGYGKSQLLHQMVKNWMRHCAAPGSSRGSTPTNGASPMIWSAAPPPMTPAVTGRPAFASFPRSI